MLTAPVSDPSRLVMVSLPPRLRVPSLVRVAPLLRRSAAVVVRVAPLATLMTLVASAPERVRVPCSILASPVKSLPSARVRLASPRLLSPPAPVRLPLKLRSLDWLTVRSCPLFVIVPPPLRSPIVSAPPRETVPSTSTGEVSLIRLALRVRRVAPLATESAPLPV